MTETTSPPDMIQREVRIAASPETVFDFWVEPDRTVQWMGREATVEPRPGGVYRIDYNGADIVRGAIVELDRPRRLVLTWGWEAAGDVTPPGASTVEVTFEPDGDGTILRLRHTGLVSDAVAPHAEGWDFFLPRLIAAHEAASAG